MREPRFKVSPTIGDADYHCVTKTVNGEWLFDEVAREVLRSQIWQVADFCGIQILTYTVMVNHFHVVLRVPQAVPISDIELLRRFRVLYPNPTPYQSARLEVITAQLKTDSPEGRAWRARQLRLMGDVSQFMKLLKQRFSIWFNRTHRRFGTLWAERFKSTLLGPGALEPMVTYVDLNCVRARLVRDPKDYRFCAYSEAVAGHAQARIGLCQVFEGGYWESVQSAYRERLFGVGAGPRDGAATINADELQKVIASGGHLPLATVLRCRIRYFTDGAVLGTHAYVEAQLAMRKSSQIPRRQREPQPLPAWTDWCPLTTLRRIRRPAVI